MALLLSLKPPLPSASPSPSPPPLLLPPLTSSLFPPTIKPSKSHHHHQTRFSSSFSNRNPPEADCPVPPEQQPINEYQSLSTSSPFSWASGDFIEYCSRLLATGAGFALFVGLPVSWYGSVGFGWEPIQRILGALCSGILVVTVAVVRMYLGWAYVGNRLLSATVEYEETGWYDGQIWVKTAQVLARDRLLGSFTVKPVLNRLKNTLVALSISLFMSIVPLINTESTQKLGCTDTPLRVPLPYRKRLGYVYALDTCRKRFSDAGNVSAPFLRRFRGRIRVFQNCLMGYLSLMKANGVMGFLIHKRYVNSPKPLNPYPRIVIKITAIPLLCFSFIPYPYPGAVSVSVQHRILHDGAKELALNEAGSSKYGLSIDNKEIGEKLSEIGGRLEYPRLTEELVQDILKIWKDPAIQETYARGNELQVPDCFDYFMENLQRLSDINYIPTKEDVLHARVRTTGVVEIQFSPVGENRKSGEVYRLFDVGGQRNERRKWIHLFDGVTAVIFCAAISEYDQTLFEDETKNRIMETKELFEWVLKQKCFEKTSFMLFLNKFDMFEKKVSKVPLNVCEWFKDYQSVSTGKQEVEHAYEFVKKKFEELYYQNVTCDDQDRVFKIYRTTALDQKLVKKTFKLVDETLRRRNLFEAGLL